MMLLNHLDEGLEQPYCYLVSTFIIITVTGEITLCLEVDRETCLITDYIHLGILDGTDRVDHMTESGNTCSKSTTYICIDECHLGCLIEVLIVHIVNQVQCLDIYRSQPLHHIHEFRHEFIVSHHITLDWLISRTTLFTGLGIHTTVDGIQQALGEIGTRTEELHLLTCLRSTHTAADGVIISPYRAHHIIILILDGTGSDRYHRCIALESLRQTTAVKYSEVRFGRRTHIL